MFELFESFKDIFLNEGLTAINHIIACIGAILTAWIVAKSLTNSKFGKGNLTGLIVSLSDQVSYFIYFWGQLLVRYTEEISTIGDFWIVVSKIGAISIPFEIAYFFIRTFLQTLFQKKGFDPAKITLIIQLTGTILGTILLPVLKYFIDKI